MSSITDFLPQTWTTIVLYISVLSLLTVAYILLFPSRVGDTSRIAFLDRILLAFRMLFARISLFINPMKEIPIKSIFSSSSSSSSIPPPKIFFNSAEEALETVFQEEKKNQDRNQVFYFAGFAATESPFVWCKALSSRRFSSFSSAPKNSAFFKNLTIVGQTGSSLRGVGSTSLDHFISTSSPGIVKKVIFGHLETLRDTLRRVEREHRESQISKDENSLEVYILPLGVISRLVGLQNQPGNNNDEANIFGPSLKTSVGLGTFLEKVNGHKVTPYSCEWNLVEKEKSTPPNQDVDVLSYKIPKITAAFLHAKVADRKGNIYFFENTLIADAFDSAMAAKKNNGKVFVSVDRVILNDDEIEKIIIDHSTSSPLILKRDFVDAIVVVDSVLQKDFSGLSQYCVLPSFAKINSKKNLETHDSICQKWEQASLAWGLATTFHSRWRNTDRHLPVVTHCHDEVLRLAKMFMIQHSILANAKMKSSSMPATAPIIRILVGVSLPELVAMRLVESRNVFIGKLKKDEGSGQILSSAEDKLKLRQENDSNLASFSTFEVIRNGNFVTTEMQGSDGLHLISGEAGTPVIQLAIESGVVGGLPCPGFLFGNSFNPYKILRGPEFWNLVNSNNSEGFAHMCILGAGEVDVYGNVNVSNSNPRKSNLSSSSSDEEEENANRRNLEKIIGCGGFPDICDGVTFAIVFVVSISSNGTRFQRTSKHSSIVQKVSEVSFSPLRALTGNHKRRPCLVRYCTEFGIFKAELWNDENGRTKTRLVAPPGLELLIQEKCGVSLFL